MTPLAQAMTKRGETAEQVAAAAGLDPQTVRQLRDGARLPQPRTAVRIADAIGVAPAELFPDAEVREPTPLAAELARRQVSVRDLARAAGVHENSVYAWAAGRAHPTAEKAVRLADTLGVPAAQLFPPTPKPPRSTQRPDRPPPDRRRAGRPGSASAAEPEAFARRLGVVMAARGLSAGQVAGQAGVSRETISRWLSGATSPQRDAAEKVAAALNLPLQPWTPAARTPATPLEVALVERGWDAHQLADIAGVSLHSARDWVAGRSRPALANAHRLAEALDRPLVELFDLHRDGEDAAVREPRPQGRSAVPTSAEVLARPATGDPGWRDDAACAAPGQDPDRWWPAPGDLGLDARATCGGCPVLGDCRDAYLSQPDRPEDRGGIWAGLFGHHLRAAARTQPRLITAGPVVDRRRSAAEAVPAADAIREQRHQPRVDHGDAVCGDADLQPATSRRSGPAQGLAM